MVGATAEMREWALFGGARAVPAGAVARDRSLPKFRCSDVLMSRPTGTHIGNIDPVGRLTGVSCPPVRRDPPKKAAGGRLQESDRNIARRSRSACPYGADHAEGRRRSEFRRPGAPRAMRDGVRGAARAQAGPRNRSIDARGAGRPRLLKRPTSGRRTPIRRSHATTHRWARHSVDTAIRTPSPRFENIGAPAANLRGYRRGQGPRRTKARHLQKPG